MYNLRYSEKVTSNRLFLMYWLKTHRKRTESKNFLYNSQTKDYEGEIQIQIHEIHTTKGKAL